MAELNPEDVREQSQQVDRRHPVAEHVRAHLLGRAAALRVAASHVEFLLTVDPDNDANIDNWWRELNAQRAALDGTAYFYRQLRDVKGMA